MPPLRLTDGGLETSLVSGWGVELPFLATFPLVADAAGRAVLRDYWRPFLDLARRHGAGLDVTTPTWRAHADWATRLGHDAEALRTLVHHASALARELASEVPGARAVGVIGPRRIGYAFAGSRSARDAAVYHLPQVEAFVEGSVDLVSALALPSCPEAVGIVRAARDSDVPVVVHFAVGPDGRLPDGTAVGEAVETVDELTGCAAAGFGISCARVRRLVPLLPRGRWTERVVSLRVNATDTTHADFDGQSSTAGDPAELERWLPELLELLPHVESVGGCCGTDVSHVRAIASTLFPTP